MHVPRLPVWMIRWLSLIVIVAFAWHSTCDRVSNPRHDASMQSLSSQWSDSNLDVARSSHRPDDELSQGHVHVSGTDWDGLPDCVDLDYFHGGAGVEGGTSTRWRGLTAERCSTLFGFQLCRLRDDTSAVEVPAERPVGELVCLSCPAGRFSFPGRIQSCQPYLSCKDIENDLIVEYQKPLARGGVKQLWRYGLFPN